MYSLNSKDRSLAELRSMQDWYLQIPAHLRRRRLRSRIGRRICEAVPGHRRPDQTARLQPLDLPMSAWRSSGATARSAAAPSRWPKRSSSCASAATSRTIEDLQKVAVGVGANGVPILLGAGREHPARARHAPRHRGAERRRRNRRRHRGRALRRQRAAGDPRREEAA